MKSFKEQMEDQGQQDQFNPEDILNAFKQLTKADPVKETHPSRISPTNVVREPKEECSMFSAVSVKSQKESLPRKTCIIKKSAQRDLRDYRGKYLNENSLGRLSNLSKSIGPNEQSEITERMMLPEDSLIQKESESLTEQEIINMEIQQKIKDLQQQFTSQQKQFEYQQSRQREALKKILKESYKKRIQYWRNASFISKIKQTIVDREVSSETSVKYLQNEDTNLRSKKAKKGLASDDQQRMTEAIAKQKKIYVFNLLARLAKERERYGSVQIGQFSCRLYQLSENRIAELERSTQLKNYQLLCSLERSSQNIEEIAVMEMQKVQEMIISCYSFNLTVPKDRRSELFQKIQEIHNQTKKLTGTSSSLFFPNKTTLFVPISNIIFNEDEVLVVNLKEECSMSLQKLMGKVQYSGGEQGMWLLRVLIRACLRVVEQISQQAGKVTTIILPSNIFINDKFEFKFRNVIFNQTLNKNFRHLLSEEDLLFFPPEEKPEPSSAALWSIGILTYLLYFGCKPFQKYQAYSWSSRQYFLIINELQIPVKTPAGEKAKQFISGCLSRKVTTSVLMQLASEGFMVSPGK